VSGVDQARQPDEIWGGAVIGRIELSAEVFRHHLSSADTLLDIGCGVGEGTQYLAHAVGVTRPVGVDISETLVAGAIERGVDARVVDLDTAPLPYPDHSFDGVFCGEVIEHVRDTDRLLDEIRRVMKPGGLCVLSTPNLASWVNRLALLVGWQPFFTTVSSRYLPGRPRWSSVGYSAGDIGHLHVFTTRALTELLSAHSLSVVALEPYTVAQTMVPSEARLGGGARHRMLAVAMTVDRLLSRRATLAIGVVVAFRNGS
jgi:methionine biosynthesis protein MetW